MMILKRTLHGVLRWPVATTPATTTAKWLRALGCLLSLLILAMIPSAAVAAGERIALLIGNSKYKEAPLRNPRNDVRDMSDMLKTFDFDVATLVDADQRTMEQAISRFTRRLGEGTVGLFYFAGHGLQIQGENFLMPVGAEIEAEGDVRYEAVSLGRVLDGMHLSRGGLNLVLLDACRNNPYTRAFRSVQRGFARSSPTSGTLIMYATEPGNVAADGDGRNGVFTGALLDSLKTTPERPVELLFKSASQAVYQKTKGKQSPWVEGVIRGDFAFSGQPRPTPIVPQPEVNRESVWAAVEQRMDLSRQEKRQVQRVLNSLNIAVGAEDGLWGATTRQGIETWQRNRGDEATGYLDEGSYKLLIAELVLPEPDPEPPTPTRRSFEPEMVRIEGGEFEQGSRDSEWSDERPVRSVRVGAFELGRYEVTVGQYRAFVESSGYKTEAERNVGEEGCGIWNGEDWVWQKGRSWRAPGFEQGENHPVACVSWNDAQAYIEWLNKNTAGGYRLPSESEWEYAARAGSRSKYHFGDKAGDLCAYGNGADKTAKKTYSDWTGVAPCEDGYVHTSPAGTYRANANGVYDMHGNVWEWVEDCWHDDYEGAPTDGIAWEQAGGGDCGRRVLRGGSWYFIPDYLRSANRDWGNTTDRYYVAGFRLSRTLTP